MLQQTNPLCNKQAHFGVDKLKSPPRPEKRESDVIWKFLRKSGEEPVYVYILMEFQSRPDPTMAVRLMGYVSHFYQNLAANQGAAASRHLSLVVPVVVYNGQERSPRCRLWRSLKPCWLTPSTV
jgi:predicted transposase YdaD